jgi:hypothetical protein
MKSVGPGIFAGFVLWGLIVTFRWWLLVVAGALVLFVGLLWLAFYTAWRVGDQYAERAALVARADQQHAWILAGDDRGIYGDYWAKQFD